MYIHFYATRNKFDHILLLVLFHKGGGDGFITQSMKDDDDLGSIPSFETDAHNIGFSDVASSLVLEDSSSSNNQEFFVSQVATHPYPKETESNPAEISSPFGLFVNSAPLDTVDLNISEKNNVSENNPSGNKTELVAINERIMSRETIVEEYQSVSISVNNASESFDLSDAQQFDPVYGGNEMKSSKLVQKSLIQDETEQIGSVSISSPQIITIKAMKSEDRCFSNFDFTMCGSENIMIRRNRAIEKPNKQKSPLQCVIC